MSPRAEDFAGRLLIVATFGYVAARTMIDIVLRLLAAEATLIWGLGVAVQSLGLMFVLLVVVMTVRRLPASSTAGGIEPRLAAIAGTFLLLLLLLLPHGEPPLAAEVGAAVLLLAGTAGSIYCLHYLGRSFSILASARELVTAGPYGIVRHPLYLAEGISTLGIILGHWSWPALLVGGAQVALQFRRMHHEERVLRDAFPAYEDYARSVPMVVPGASV